MEIATTNWQDYEIIDAGNKNKLERWHDVVLVRPDPQAIWNQSNDKRWQQYDGIYHRSEKGGGTWEFRKKLPENWTITYRDLVFKVSPTNFKHTGIFPEQATNWDWMANLIKNANKDVKVLNLFGYTGAATISASKAGAVEVVHVDASKGMVNWAKENMVLNHLEDHTIRFMVDDVLKFVKREQRRGNKYHAIIMDPPSYGRGPNGELWKLEDTLEELIIETSQLLDDEPIGYLTTCYTTGFSGIALDNMLKKHLIARFPHARVNTVELGIPITASKMVLPAGISGRVEF